MRQNRKTKTNTNYSDTFSVSLACHAKVVTRAVKGSQNQGKKGDPPKGWGVQAKREEKRPFMDGN